MGNLKKVSVAIALVGMLVIGLMIPSSAAGDKTPSPTVEIDYDITQAVNALKDDLEVDQPYYLLADSANFNGNTYEGNRYTDKPSEAFWKVNKNNSNVVNVDGLYLGPNDLVDISGDAVLTFAGETYAYINSGEIKYADLAAEGLGKPDHTEDGIASTAAIRYHAPDGGITYYTFTKNGWFEAAAKVADLYYIHFYNEDDDGATTNAVEAANAGTNQDILLLSTVTITASVGIDDDVAVYCCNDSALIVGSGGVFTMDGQVLDREGAKTPVYLESGGTIIDNNAIGNVITATLTLGSARVTGTNTQLTANTGPDALVYIDGTYADLIGGNFALSGPTTVNGTGSTQTATITDIALPLGYSLPQEFNGLLAVNGGEVHTTVGFERLLQIYITGGTLFVEIPATSDTFITGGAPANGVVYSRSGTANIYGELDVLHVEGYDDYQTGGYVWLYGKVESATATGACTLNLTAQDAGVIARITPGDIHGSGRMVGATYYYPKLSISTSVYNADKVYAIGRFHQIAGEVWMSGDLVIEDISSTMKVGSYGETYALEIMGADGKASVSTQLEGTFGYVTVNNVDMSITSGIRITRELNVNNADVVFMYGATLGGAATQNVAAGTITDGVLSFDNASIYARFEGEGEAELHIAANCDGASIIGVQGEFKSITGRVHTCGDLTLLSTKGNGTYADKAVIVGGMTFYGDDGMAHALILKDFYQSTIVELDSGKTSIGSRVSTGFKFIRVEDEVENGCLVSLTMRSGGAPVSIGSPAENGPEGLYVAGDSATVIDLVTHDIYGLNYGVKLQGVAANITGSDSDTYKLISGASQNGVDLTGSTLTMQYYDVRGAVKGVNMAGSAATVSDVIVTGSSSESEGRGLHASASTLNLSSAAVTGRVGIQADAGSTVSLANAISVTGVEKGIYVTNGSVSNPESDRGADIANLTRLMEATGTNGMALCILQGAIDLNGYAFEAKQPGGIGVYTGSNAITAALSDKNHPSFGEGGAHIWGYDTGIVVGVDTEMILSDYGVYGAAFSGEIKAAQYVVSGKAGAQVFGTLWLEGENAFIGGENGLYVKDGTVTNFKAGSVWTDEKAEGAAPQGSGSIGSGPQASTVAIRAEGGRVTLGYYHGISIGVASNNPDSMGVADSYGLLAAEGSTVYLLGDETGSRTYTVSGGVGSGVRVDGGSEVTIYHMKVSTVSSHSAQVDSGVLNLGANVTLDALGGTRTVVGTSFDNAELHIFAGNQSFESNRVISAQGSFKRLTGYITTTGDLAVKGTGNENAYNQEEYQAQATILGGALTHDLLLGTDQVTAALVDDSAFASVKVAGTDTNQQSLTVMGDLTVANADMPYALFASHADVEFMPYDAEGALTPSGADEFIRSFTAAGTGSRGVDAGAGALILLTDQVNITGSTVGLSLTVDAVITNMKDGEEAWLTAYATQGTPVSYGQITATGGETGTAIWVSGQSVLLLGHYDITGKTRALHITGTTEASGVYLKAREGMGSERILTITGPIEGNDTFNYINTEGYVTIEDYNAIYIEPSGCAQIFHIVKGNITLDGGTCFGYCPSIVMAGESEGPLSVTLKGDIQIASGYDDNNDDSACILVSGYDSDNPAILDIQHAAIISAAETGVLIGRHAQVSMSDQMSIIVGQSITGTMCRYGVRLTESTSRFNKFDGNIIFSFQGDTYAIYAEDGAVIISGGGAVAGTYAIKQLAGEIWISGGHLDVNDTVTSEPVISTNGSLWFTGGEVEGLIVGTGEDAALYIRPVEGPVARVAGQFKAMTGRAVVIGGVNSDSLNVGSTDDALNPFGAAAEYTLFSTSQYANGSAEPFDKLILTGEAGTPDTAVTIQAGTVDISGTFAQLTAAPDESLITVIHDTLITGEGSLIGPLSTLVINQGKTLTLGTGGTGFITTQGTVIVQGEVEGIVVGEAGPEGLVSILSVENASGTNVNAGGTFAQAVSLNDANTITLANNLEIASTGEGSVYVIGNAGGSCGLDLGETAVAYIKGEFGYLNGSVILFGDTEINGNGSAVVTGMVPGAPLNLTAGGDASITVQDGAYAQLAARGTVDVTVENGAYAALDTSDSADVDMQGGTVTALTVSGGHMTITGGSFSDITVRGGTLTVDMVLSMDEIRVESGALEIAGKLYTDKIYAGSGKVAKLEGNRNFHFTGTLATDGAIITDFPIGVSRETFLGWTLTGDSVVISDNDYTIAGGESLSIKWYFKTGNQGTLEGGAGVPTTPPAQTKTFTVSVNHIKDGLTVYTGPESRLGAVAVKAEYTAGENVVFTATPKTSFQVAGVKVTDSSGGAVAVTVGADGAYTFTMPESGVTILVEYEAILSTPQETAPVIYAVRSPQSIYFNGELIAIMAYNINDNNYFKLRDIAYLLNGTLSQFSVSFNEYGLVFIATGEPYEPVGGELTVGEDQSETCVVSSWSIEVNGVIRYLKCYNIAGNNYFQLRELGTLLGFQVDYDAETNSVLITAAVNP